VSPESSLGFQRRLKGTSARGHQNKFSEILSKDLHKKHASLVVCGGGSLKLNAIWVRRLPDRIPSHTVACLFLVRFHLHCDVDMYNAAVQSSPNARQETLPCRGQ
jgi:hypothetical protein